jgi:hypothetical protein
MPSTAMHASHCHACQDIPTILFLIYKMQNKIKKSKIFIKINIREGYYKIRIKKSEEWKTA